VQLAGGGFQETGAGYEGISASIEKVEGQLSPAEAAGGAALVGAMAELTEELRRARGGPVIPRPGGA
jgi:hypothetical protein